MRRLGPVLVMTLGTAAAAQEAPEVAIPGVIGAQIEAFRADDVGAAFRYAAPGIQQLFETPFAFGVMVQSGYPMVWRPATVQYLGLAPVEGGMVQTVVMADAAGALHVLDYLMVEGPEGWRIAGVRLVEMPIGGA